MFNWKLVICYTQARLEYGEAAKAYRAAPSESTGDEMAAAFFRYSSHLLRLRQGLGRKGYGLPQLIAG